MGLKIVVHLTFLCAVNALVTINVFDEDRVKEVVSNFLVDCNDRDCNSMCRDNHHTAGWCVDGECSCSNALGTESERGCNLFACEQLCWRLGFPGGACVGDKCKCDNFLPAKASDSHTIEGGCDLRACEQLCWRLGFPGGACVGDKCKCDNFLPPTDEASNLQACSSSTCSQLCKRMGYSGGDCDGDRCKCNIWMRTGFHLPSGLKALLKGLRKKKTDSEVISERTCDVMRCNDMCHRMHYAGGICVSDACICY